MAVSPEVLAELIDRHWAPLVASVGADDRAAEDVVQQAFIALAAERVSPENPTAWLYKTSRNLAINERKQRERRRVRQGKAAQPERQPSDAFRNSEAAELNEHLGQLSDDAREIVVARIWGGLSFDEIAGVVGKSRATVWRHYRAAIETLRESYGVSCETEN